MTKEMSKEKLFLGEKNILLKATGYPTEFSFFHRGSYDALISVVSPLAGVDSHKYTADDVYFDTDDRSLFKQNLSLRLRKINKSADKYFILVVTLKPGSKESAAGAKETVNVQEVSESVFPMDKLIKSYAQQGLQPVATVAKTRTAFVLDQLSFKEEASGRVSNGFPDRHGKWNSADYGLRILIDEFNEPIDGYNIAIEVEFGDDQTERAMKLRSDLTESLADDLVPKGSKIEYFQPK